MTIGSRLLRCCRLLRPAWMVAIWILVLLVAQHGLSGQEVVLHKFVSPNLDPTIERLLYLAAGIELERAGISSTLAAKNEEFILLTRYSTSRGAVTVDYTLLAHHESDRLLASAKTTVPLNQNLDAKVAETIRKLLAEAGIKAKSSPNAEIEGVLPAASVSPEQAPTPKETAKPNPAPPPPTPPARTPALPSPLPPATPSVTTERTPHEGPTLRFLSNVSAAGVLFFGQITQYLHYGVAGSATAGLEWQTERGSIALGTKLSVVRAFNDWNVIGGPLYLSTAGLSLRVATGSGKPYRFAAVVSGGAAFLTVVGTQKTQTNTAPYGDVGLHAAVPIGKRFSIGGTIRFLTIIDKGLLIMAAEPAVTLSTR